MTQEPPAAGPAQAPLVLHASAVALEGRGLLLMGASGRGKSALALELMAMGADLVADDRTELWPDPDGAGVVLRCPAPIAGMIEARGVGLLRAACVAEARAVLAVDLDVTETERLPPFRQIRLLGNVLPLVHGSAARHFPAALLHYLRAGRVA